MARRLRSFPRADPYVTLYALAQPADPEFSELYDAVAWLVRVERRKRGLTQKQLAEQMGVSRGVIERIESGTSEVSLLMSARIAKAFGWELRKLGYEIQKAIINPLRPQAEAAEPEPEQEAD